MAKKPAVWKSPLEALEGDLERAAHDDEHPTLRTGYGNLAVDPIGPLAGLPLVGLRLYRLQAGAPLAQLGTFSKLEGLLVEEPDLEAAKVVEAALGLRSLRTLSFRPLSKRKDEPLPDALVERLVRALPSLEHLQLRGVTLSDAALATLVSTKRLIDLELSGVRGLEAPVIEDQPSLRGLHLYAWATSLRLARLPVLERLLLGGRFTTMTLEGLPAVEELELDDTKHATLHHIGARSITVGCLESLELTDAPNLAKLDLTNAADTLAAERIEALRAALPACDVRPKARKPRKSR